MTGPPPVETGTERIPRWILGIGAAVVILGVVSLTFNLEGTNPDLVGPPPSGQPSSSGGGTADAMALIEHAGCQSCHGDDLTGLVGPSLHGIAAGPKSENLQQLGTDHPDDWPNLWIDGSGPEVAGLDRGGMPVFGGPDGQLSTDDIATIVEYLYTLE
jgi:mono/diheme cytochrome c family protein